jgi:hypothetical protein
MASLYLLESRPEGAAQRIDRAEDAAALDPGIA